MFDQPSLAAQLSVSLQTASSEWRAGALRQLSALFIAAAPTYRPEHVAIYDEVMTLLIDSVDQTALSELSRALALVPNAPHETVVRLARHNSLTVAGPVLESSEALTNPDLVEIIKMAAPGHLLAIAGRARIDAEVADSFVERRNTEAMHKLAGNRGAAFSELGFVKLINEAKRDKELAALIAGRPDIPEELKSFVALLT